MSHLLRPGEHYVEFARSEIEQSIPDRFAAQVRLHPERLAVSAYGQSLTYGELDLASNVVAASLAGGAPRPIAIQPRQNVNLAATILGVLKAGHFYVPGDRVPEGGASDTPDSLAYVYFTSGSTGEPKGVMDCHRNVLHNVMRYTNALTIGAGDRLTLLQTAEFSGAVSSLFCALLNGAASFPLSPREETPRSLARWVNEHQLTMWHSVPSLFRQLCASGERFPSIRVIRLEGDQSAPGDITLFRRHFAEDCVLVNGLGATETGITRQYFFTQQTPIPEGTVPIGYAVEDMEAVLLDKEDSVGEIGIRSHYLALGYWQRPDLTARAFLPCPDGRRVYRTGDMGRMAADGCLEHLGRKDHAFKIAGRYVDTAAVEASLARLPGIAQAAVGARPGSNGDPRLCAWVVPAPGAAPPLENIRAALPMPGPVMMLEALPVTAFGKLDRRALPDPPPERPPLATPFTAPSTADERRIAALWSRVLGIDGIGAGDNFFDLGGSSLAAARVSGELNVTIETFLAAPTIRQLAAGNHVPNMLVRIRDGAHPPLFCAAPHSGVLLGYQHLSRHLNRAVYGFVPQLGTVRELALRNIEAMRAIEPRGPYHLSGHCFGGWVVYQMACLLAEQGERVETLALVECYFDGWYRSQPGVKRAAIRATHAARRAAHHLAAGPGHWSKLRRRVKERREGSGPIDGGFVPHPYHGRVLLLEGAAPRAGEYPAPRMGWHDLLRGEVEHVVIDDQWQGLLSEALAGQVAARFNF